LERGKEKSSLLGHLAIEVECIKVEIETGLGRIPIQAEAQAVLGNYSVA